MYELLVHVEMLILSLKVEMFCPINRRNRGWSGRGEERKHFLLSITFLHHQNNMAAKVMKDYPLKYVWISEYNGQDESISLYRPWRAI